MRHRWVAACFLLAFACGAPQPTVPRARPDVLATPDLAIEIQRTIGLEGNSLLVTERFRGAHEGRTHVLLPHHFGGQTYFERGVTDVEVMPKAAAARRHYTPPEYEIDAPPDTELTLRYRVRETPTPRGQEGDRRFRPFIEREYFHFFGSAVLAMPYVDDAPKTIELAWKGFDDGFAIVNSFGEGSRTQRFNARPKDVWNAVYVGGDFRVQKVEARGGPVVVALHGAFEFKDGDLADHVARVAGTEREFWKEDDFPYFLVTMMQAGANHGFRGTGVTNAVSTQVAADTSLDEGVDRLLAHELFHTWNGLRLAIARDPEELTYWFREGFTYYYADVIALRARLIDLRAHVKWVDEGMASYFESPALHATNQDVADRFWSDRAVREMPYQRGALLAANWNARIVAASHGSKSLDDAMRDLRAAARDAGGEVTMETFDAVVARCLPSGEADVARYVDAGETIDPDPTALGPCVALEKVEVPAFDLGFDHVAGSGEIHGVRPDGPAYRAGLRDGMHYSTANWMPGRSNAAVTVALSARDGGKTITYMPAGKTREIPQYRVIESEMAKDEGRCVGWFGVK